MTEKRKAFYHFITTLCAIVGGVYTVAGIVDGLLHQSVQLAKKIDLGKQVCGASACAVTNLLGINTTRLDRIHRSSVLISVLGLQFTIVHDHQ